MIDKRVLPLAIGGLGIGTTEFAIMGLLPEIAQSLQVSIPQAGHFISAYALGVVIGAPLLIGFTVKFPPKKVLIAFMLLFTLFNGLSALANDYWLMLLIRFMSGLPHGAFFGVSTVVAAQMAGKGKEALYIALVFTGLTFANLAMVPLMTYIGHTFHWRLYFMIVSVIGLATIFSLLAWLPVFEGKKDAPGLFKQMDFLKSRESWLVLLITAIGFGGLFSWLSYINPLMTQVAGISTDNMAYVMILVGCGMVVGNLLGGYLSDKLGDSKTNIIMQGLMMVALLSVFYLSDQMWIAYFLTFVCGGLAMSGGSPVNIMMMKAAPQSPMMAAAFMQAAFNVANALGAYLGGLPLEFGKEFTYPALVGSGLAGLGLLISLLYFIQYGRNYAKSKFDSILMH